MAKEAVNMADYVGRDSGSKCFLCQARSSATSLLETWRKQKTKSGAFRFIRNEMYYCSICQQMQQEIRTTIQRVKENISNAVSGGEIKETSAE